MTAPRTGTNESSARKTSLALVALAVVNIASVALLVGCDGADSATGHAANRPAATDSTSSALTIMRAATAIDQPQTVYLPGGHTIDPNAGTGNVATHERD